MYRMMIMATNDENHLGTYIVFSLQHGENTCFMRSKGQYMTSNHQRRLWVFTFLPRALTIIVGLAIVGAVSSSMPHTKITLEAGTDGGLFDVMTHQLADELAPHGIDVTIVNRPDSLKIVDDIADPDSPIDAGFIASDAPKEDYQLIKQVGTVMLAPVYLITRNDSNVQDISMFKDRSISLYPVGSAAWAACEYVLGSYEIPIVESQSKYGNGPTIVENVSSGITDVGCFIDVPSGTSLPYADTIMKALSNDKLRFIGIPQAQALQARKDYLRPLTVPSGAFHVYPARPATDISTTGASLTFVAKETLPRELVTMIAQVLAEEYRGATTANFAGQLPATNYMNLPVFEKAKDVYSSGLPWMYERFSFGTASFLDKFINQYGIALTLLFLFLSAADVAGLPLPYELIVGSRPKRMRMMIESIERSSKLTGKLSRRDQRKLVTFEKWLEKESSGIEGLEEQLQDMRRNITT
jgi:TRAP-type uncharacterized transport system substrate-binding protein